MLKKLIPVAALIAAIACSDSTGPSHTIKVRVVDDAGDPVYRTQVTVTFDGHASVSRLTGRDGTATIGVAESGDYVVRVIPRSGYSGLTGPLTQTVSVTANQSSTVDFTIFREGLFAF